jgi:hypothetical protein
MARDFQRVYASDFRVTAADFRDRAGKIKQKRSEAVSAAKRSDDAPANSKKPQRDLSKEQKYATAGDTIPIVFCKRVSNVGGVWVQPQLLKEGSYNFTGQFLYAISQGDLADSPLARRAFVGERSLEYTPGITATLTHYFSSAATMAASPNSCPITGGKIFCEPQAAYYIFYRQKVGGFASRDPDYSTLYWQIRTKTIGSGDTSNTVLVTPGTDVKAYEIATGTDRTTEFWTAVGLNPSAFTFYLNGRYDSGGSLIGGRTVGTVTGTRRILIFGQRITVQMGHAALFLRRRQKTNRSTLQIQHQPGRLSVLLLSKQSAQLLTRQVFRQATILRFSQTSHFLALRATFTTRAKNTRQRRGSFLFITSKALRSLFTAQAHLARQGQAINSSILPCSCLS